MTCNKTELCEVTCVGEMALVLPAASLILIVHNVLYLGGAQNSVILSKAHFRHNSSCKFKLSLNSLMHLADIHLFSRYLEIL